VRYAFVQSGPGHAKGSVRFPAFVERKDAVTASRSADVGDPPSDFRWQVDQ